LASQGVDLICRQAFNCSFTEVALTNDESHNTPHLRKFELRQLDDQVLLGTFDCVLLSVRNRFSYCPIPGVVYADLHSRDHKFRHSATFPLTCAHVHPDVRSIKQTFGESDFQLPRALLVCNLAPPQPTSAPSVKRPNIIYQVSGKMVNESFLNEVEMVNLYHELGHCLHLLMSRTRFQHLSGTRAALDFIELPSILFEYFCLHEKTIGAFAVHHQTGQPIPDRLIKALRQGRHFFAGLEAQSNIMLAMFDMLLCGPNELFQRANIKATESPLELFNELNKALLPKMQQHLAHTHWFTKFGHLTSYASGYYNYLWCTVWASKLWHSSFAHNPLDRKMGMRYRNLVLAQGNAVEARKILSDFLGQCDVSDISDSWVKTDLNGPKL
jgi:intermediate peptidase